MIEIKLEEASSLTLEMVIEGDVKDESADLRFSIMSEGLRYSFPGREIESGIYSIDFPEMLGKIQEGEYRADVEIFVDGRHFVPLSETVKFTREVKPVVKMTETVAPKVQPAAVSVKMGKVEKAPAAPKVEMIKISDVKGIVTHLVESNGGRHYVDTFKALDVLNNLVAGSTFTLSETVVVEPAKKATEAEVLATLKMIERYGYDISNAGDFRAIMGVSDRVREEMRTLLLNKGLPARDLQQYL